MFVKFLLKMFKIRPQIECTSPTRLFRAPPIGGPNLPPVPSGIARMAGFYPKAPCSAVVTFSLWNHHQLRTTRSYTHSVEPRSDLLPTACAV